MRQAEFDLIVKETIDSIQKLLVSKGAEYAGSEDRLANFKRGAQLTGASSLQVLFIYLSKHYDALSTYVKGTSNGRPVTLSEPIASRLDDLINYCILAKALISEQAGVDSGGLGLDRSGFLPVAGSSGGAGAPVR